MQPECSSCYLPITDRVIRDHGNPWCEPCLKLRTEAKAAANADRYIAKGVAQARLLCEIQRKPVAA